MIRNNSTSPDQDASPDPHAQGICTVVELVSRERAGEIAPQYLEARRNATHLDLQPPNTTLYRDLEVILARAHFFCIVQGNLAALSISSIWATYWWTVAFLAPSLVVAGGGALLCRSPFHIGGKTCRCLRSASLVHLLLYGELILSVAGLFAGISSVVGAVEMSGGVGYVMAVLSTVVCFLTVPIAGGVAYLMGRTKNIIKAPVAVIVLSRDGSGQRQSSSAEPFEPTAATDSRPRGAAEEPRFAIHPPVAVPSLGREDAATIAADGRHPLQERKVNHQGHPRHLSARPADSEAALDVPRKNPITAARLIDHLAAPSDYGVRHNPLN